MHKLLMMVKKTAQSAYVVLIHNSFECHVFLCVCVSVKRGWYIRSNEMDEVHANEIKLAD